MPAELVAKEDLAKLARALNANIGAAENEISRLKGWRRAVEADDAFGRIMSGQQWIGGISILDGEIEGSKLAANVVISSLFTTSDPDTAPTADRLNLDNTGFRAYGTVSGVPNTQTVNIGVDGSFAFGSGANQITYVPSTNVLTVPAAVIGSLTIATVGSGTMGGTYRTAAAGTFPRMDISTAGVRAYNSGSTQTFFLDASNGDLSMVGNFTLASSLAASNRLVMKQTGIELWKSGTREFFLDDSGSAAVQMLLTGPSAGQYIGLEPSSGKGLWLGASTFASAPFRVALDGTATMLGGTIQTAGSGARVELTPSGLIAYSSGSTQTVNISGSSSTITAGTFRTAASGARVEFDASGIFQYNSGGSLTAQIWNNGTGSIGIGTATPINWGSTSNSTTMGTLSSVGTLTIASGGKIIDADGSYWDQAGITLASAAAGAGDVLRWVSGATVVATADADASGMYLQAGTSGAAVTMKSVAGGNGLLLSAGSSTDVAIRNTGNMEVRGRIYPGTQSAGGVQTTRYIDITSSRIRFMGGEVQSDSAIYPGLTGSTQASVNINSDGSHMNITLANTSTSQFRVFSSAFSQVWGVDATGTMQLAGSDTTVAGTQTGRVPVAWNGGTGYLHIYNG